MKEPRVSIIILNWNGWQDTVECLESLYRISYPNYEVIVVDNCSKDGSVEKIKEWADGKIKAASKFFKYSSRNKPIKYFDYTKEELEKETYLIEKKKFDKLKSNKRLFILKNEKNYGFVEGNNIQMEQSLKEGSQYVLLLNNDVIVHKDFLNELVKAAENNDKIGVVGPKTYFYDYNGKKDVIAYIGNRFNPWTGQEIPIGSGQKDHNQFNKNIVVDYVTGCAILIKALTIKKIGLLNKLYAPIYYEDVDFCIKAKKKNFLVIGIPSSMIWHKIARTVKTNNPMNIYLKTRNRFYLMKRINSLNYLVFLIYFLFYKGIRNLGRLILYNKSLIKPFLLGIIDGLINRDNSNRFY